MKSSVEKRLSLALEGKEGAGGWGNGSELGAKSRWSGPPNTHRIAAPSATNGPGDFRVSRVRGSVALGNSRHSSGFSARPFSFISEPLASPSAPVSSNSLSIRSSVRKGKTSVRPSNVYIGDLFGRPPQYSNKSSAKISTFAEFPSHKPSTLNVPESAPRPPAMNTPDCSPGLYSINIPISTARPSALSISSSTFRPSTLNKLENSHRASALSRNSVSRHSTIYIPGSTPRLSGDLRNSISRASIAVGYPNSQLSTEYLPDQLTRPSNSNISDRSHKPSIFVAKSSVRPSAIISDVLHRHSASVTDPLPRPSTSDVELLPLPSTFIVDPSYRTSISVGDQSTPMVIHSPRPSLSVANHSPRQSTSIVNQSARPSISVADQQSLLPININDSLTRLPASLDEPLSRPSTYLVESASQAPPIIENISFRPSTNKPEPSARPSVCKRDLWNEVSPTSERQSISICRNPQDNFGFRPPSNNSEEDELVSNASQNEGLESTIIVDPQELDDTISLSTSDVFRKEVESPQTHIDREVLTQKLTNLQKLVNEDINDVIAYIKSF